MFDSILVVCVGNICRSPVGERILKNYLSYKIVESAGLNAVAGHSADDTAQRVAQQHGISLEGHIARQVTFEMCKRNDLILVMEKKHLASLCNLFPEIRGKTMLFGHWDKDVEIYDPYRKNQEVFEAVFNMLDKSAYQWAKVLGK
ncbi:protein tyrosine phosphatase [Sodalis sp. RH15]|uniref:arsenate reductase/protein-tyrosine-phosphatase family protein n=1 Tax=Sodalis sp. RH15 TaxID=3394330 RepID=UPI0039B5B54F